MRAAYGPGERVPAREFRTSRRSGYDPGVREYGREIAGAVLVLSSRIAAMPRTPWQADELAIMAALQGIAPEPRYPLYVGFSKAAYLLLGDPFVSLMCVNVLASVATFVVLSLALRTLLRDDDAAAAAALIFSLSAGVVVQSSAALPEALAIFFVVAMLYAFAHERDLWAGVFASLAIGSLPQLAFAVVPAFAAGLLLRRRVLALAAFVVVTVSWGVPWLEGGGGSIAPDVDLSRVMQALPRFALHPWGGKFVTAPLLLCALAGMYALARKLDRKLLPFFVFAACNLTWAVLAADPQSGVRVAVPSMLLLALSAGAGLALTRNAVVTFAGAAILGGVSLAYVWPLLHERATQPSPVVRAAALANRTLKDDALVVYYGESVAAVRALLPRFDQLPVDEALRRVADRPGTMVVALYSGTSREAEATVFSSTDDDVHRKMLGSTTRSATLDPVRPPERYVPLRNAYDFERTAEGIEWRWLGPDAAIELPPQHRQSGTITLRLSEDAPFASTVVTVGESQLTVTKEAATFRVRAADQLVIRSAQSFVPAKIKASADQRLLSVQLMDVEF
jgi:hypothetical protein